MEKDYTDKEVEFFVLGARWSFTKVMVVALHPSKEPKARGMA